MWPEPRVKYAPFGLMPGSVRGATESLEAVLPAAVYLLHPDRRGLVGLFVLLAALIILLHRENIKRLLSGTESRFGQRPA